MSQERINNKSSYEYAEVMDHLDNKKHASAIHLPPSKENVEFYITSVMLQFLDMIGLFGVQSHEDANLNLKNFIEVCTPFDVAHIYKESIRFRLFPFSLMGERMLWLRSLPAGFIIS